ncbi:MAG: hypothetical protein IT243_08755 [Bacteroidia bacterium]|nr:hypothetical protein [Bacteroidia bacterium]
MLVISSLTASAQPPFETHYGSILNSNDVVGSEFVTCPSINESYSYVAVGSVLIPPPEPGNNGTYAVRGVRVKSDGTMLTSTFDYIQESSLNYNIFPLKIISINNNTEYLITGYVTRVSGIYAAPLRPYPFVIKTDENLNATVFKIFTDHEGFFTDVDEIPNSGGDLLFIGAKSFLTSITPYTRSGWMLRTDPTNFTAQWMRYLHNDQIPSGHNYHIVHDAITLDGDNALICGSTNDRASCAENADSFYSRAFIAKIDLNDGSFIWQKSLLRKFLGIRLAVNNAHDKIAMAFNGEQENSYSGIIYFDNSGNVLTYKMCEVSPTPLNNVNFTNNSSILYPCEIHIHYKHIIQNIYFLENDEDVFLSGKFVNTEVKYNNNTVGYFDMPFCTLFDYSSDLFGSISLYKSAQTFPNMLSTFLSYDSWQISNCVHIIMPQFYCASNTLPCNSNCNGNDKFVTITLDKAEYSGSSKEDKVWIFSNDNKVCGYETTTISTFNLNLFEHIDIINDDIIVVPEVEDFDFYNTDPTRYIHNCIQN